VLRSLRLRWQFALIVGIITILDALIGLVALTLAFGIGDGGGRVPWWLNAIVGVTGAPGMYLASGHPSALGDPASTIAAFVLTGALWGCALAAAIAFRRSRRSSSVSPAG
jgi:hypothetical protein